jgi:hypothetical protein
MNVYCRFLVASAASCSLGSCDAAAKTSTGSFDSGGNGYVSNGGSSSSGGVADDATLEDSNGPTAESDAGASPPGDDALPVAVDGGPIVRTPIAGSGCAADNFTQTTFVNLAPPIGAPLDRSENDPLQGDAGTVPAGWNFYDVPGAICRDGSPVGIYVHYSSSASSKLMIYLEGGGACMSPHFCDHNPANMQQVFPGGSSNGESFGGSLFTVAGLQAPYSDGIFDFTNPANPFRDWNQVYIPYCTGDAHFGTNDSAQLEDGVNPLKTNTWHFVGYKNMQKFIGRIVPTFPGADQVVLTGSSAGGLGAGLNYGMVQDAFGSVPVTLIDDSFPPFPGTDYITACLQKINRDLWGLDASIPSDCAECTSPDGSGIPNIVPYWHHKYPNAKAGLISSVHDQIIRLFLAAGTNDCSDTDPNFLSGLGFQGGDVPSFDGGTYETGLDLVRTTYSCTNVISSYYIGTGDPDASDVNGSIDTLHQFLFRPRFYDPLAGPGQPTLAQWVADFVGGKMEQVGP